jgi:hypothetical protein
MSALLLVGVALGATKKDPPTRIEVQQVTKAKGSAKKAEVIRPLVLPNIHAVVKQMWKVDRKTLAVQQKKSATVLAFFDGKGRWLRAPRHKKCWEVPWQRSCTVARAAYRLHEQIGRVTTMRLMHELPLTNDWLTAVRLVQRVYPGTADWMLAISDREGGWGPWVWYSGMCSNPPCLWTGHHLGADPFGDDAVGGPMQFRYSTFAPYWRAATQDVKARGFMLPDLGWARPRVEYGASTGYGPWLSPLGQAITAGYMRYHHRDGCHWC